MPPKSDRPDDLTADQFREEPAELTPPSCDMSPAVPPAIPAGDPAPKPDYVLVADWIARPRMSVAPAFSAIVEGLAVEDTAWTPERVSAAIKKGVSKWCLQECYGGSGETSVTLTPVEAKLRNLRPWSGKKGYEWASAKRKDRTQKKTFRVATKSKVILEADLNWDEDHVGGRAKIKSTKSQLSTLAKISSSAHVYLEVLEGFEKGHGYTKGKQGQEVLEAAMGFGAGFHGMGSPWPDKDWHSYDKPADPPSDPGIAGPCSDCEGKELRLPIYCPRCDRTGADEWVRHVKPLEKDAPPRRGPDLKPRKSIRKDADGEVNGNL